MSADNWTTCPKCIALTEDSAEAAQRALDEQYGQVDRDAYKALEEAARDAVAAVKVARSEQKATFREDYEFTGAEDGIVTASYSGGCRTCGLRVKFEHSVTFFPEPQP
jgi:chromosome condensin MukBEF complex kleisin-like MukF subunit